MFRRLDDSFMATFMIEKKYLMIIIKTSSRIEARYCSGFEDEGERDQLL